jgi:hypothetical protein
MRTTICLVLIGALLISACKKGDDTDTMAPIPGLTGPRIKSYGYGNRADTTSLTVTTFNYDVVDTSRILSYKAVSYTGSTFDSAVFDYPVNKNFYTATHYRANSIIYKDSIIYNSKHAVLSIYVLYPDQSRSDIVNYFDYNPEGQLEKARYGILNSNSPSFIVARYEWLNGNIVSLTDSSDPGNVHRSAYSYDLSQPWQVASEIGNLTLFGGYGHTSITKNLRTGYNHAEPGTVSTSWSYGFDSKGRVVRMIELYSNGQNLNDYYRFEYY